MKQILDLPKCQLTNNSLHFDKSISFEEWSEVGKTLSRIHGAVQFWIGDWIRFGEGKFGEKYSQALESTDYSYKALRNMKYVADKVDLSLRKDNLDFSIYMAIAPLEPKEQAKWLKTASEKHLTVKQLKTEIKRSRIENRRPIKKGSAIELFNTDFREARITPGSVDLILTDPPYPKDYLELWSELSAFASNVLKPGGFLISYSGQAYLPEIIESLSEKLEYYWLGMLYHKGQAGQRFEVNMFNRAKPILFFYKPPMKKQDTWIEDVLISIKPDKDIHDWGQSVEPLITLIEAFTDPGEVVLDPFVGGGSVVEASTKIKRTVIGIEKDPDTFKQLKKRVK